MITVITHGAESYQWFSVCVMTKSRNYNSNDLMRSVDWRRVIIFIFMRSYFVLFIFIFIILIIFNNSIFIDSNPVFYSVNIVQLEISATSITIRKIWFVIWNYVNKIVCIKTKYFMCVQESLVFIVKSKVKHEMNTRECIRHTFDFYCIVLVERATFMRYMHI